MKKFLVTRFSASHVASLEAVSFETDGDVTITGQNGVGKSTIGRAILWALQGTINDGERLISRTAKEMPRVEVELYDGQNYLMLTKQIIQSVDSQGRISRTAEHTMNGRIVQQKDFQDYFYKQVPATEMFKCLLNLGSFFLLRPDVQRQILTKLFCNVTDAEIIASDEKFSGLNNGVIPVEEFGEQMKSLKLKLTKDAAAIPKQIEELERQTVEVQDNRATLNFEIHALETELAFCKDRLQAILDSRKGYDAKRKKLGDVNSEYFFLVSVPFFFFAFYFFSKPKQNHVW